MSRDWKKEPIRHSLAARGVETKKAEGKKIKVDFDEIDFEEEVLQKLKVWADKNGLRYIEDYPSDGWITVVFGEYKQFRMNSSGHIELIERGTKNIEMGSIKFTDKSIIVENEKGERNEISKKQFPLERIK